MSRSSTISAPSRNRTSRRARSANGSRASPPSQNEFRQVGVLGERADLGADIVAVDRHGGIGRLVGGGEADLLEQALQHRMEAPRADILDRGVDLFGERRDLVD